MCYYQGKDYPEGSYVCMGADKYVCFEGRWLLALENAPECVEEAGWKRLATRYVTLVPSEEEVGGWKSLVEYTITLTPTGVPPECETDADCPADKPFCVDGKCVECRTGADCPEGYVCKAGKCVKKEAAFPWQWLAIGGVAIAGVLLLIPKPKKAKEKK